MEAQKTLDRISTGWVLRDRELDRDIIESDRKTELRYMKEQGLEQGTLYSTETGCKKRTFSA